MAKKKCGSKKSFGKIKSVFIAPCGVDFKITDAEWVEIKPKRGRPKKAVESTITFKL